MSDLSSVHDTYNAQYRSNGGRTVIAHYGQPAQTHLAVREGAGVIHQPVDLISVAGNDRVTFVDNVLSNRVPSSPGAGVYAFLLTPTGRVRIAVSVYATPEALLLVAPPETASEIITEWRDHIFIQDVTINDATDAYSVFGLHGPTALDQLMAVFDETLIPEAPYACSSGNIAGVDVTVAASDAPTGETGFTLLCADESAGEVFEALLEQGGSAVPFGQQTWETLTLEAGTPLFSSEIAGQIPNDIGCQAALDFEKGCFVGQEIVSRIEHRGHPARRLVGIQSTSEIEAGMEVHHADDIVGTVTRGVMSPSLETSIGFAYVPFELDAEIIEITSDHRRQSAHITPLPFVTGSAVSARIPSYTGE